MHRDELAVRARTTVDAARVGQLTTYGRHPSGQRTTSVSVRPRPDGSVDVLLARDAVGARQLLARPVATLELAPDGCEPVLLHGSARRQPGHAGGALLFRLQVSAVRVGAPAVLLDERSYLAAAPDRLAADAPGVLAHLNGAHADALTACLRAVGHPVDFARATGLDGDGLTVAAVTATGVGTVHLAFPQPITALSQLPAGLSALLSPRCGCSADRPCA